MTLRTPPIRGSLLALRERVGVLNMYGDRTINEVIADLYERVGVTPPPPPPPPPSTTLLWDESFEGGIDGEIASTATTTADSAFGSGTLTHSDGWSLDGGASLWISGTQSHYLRKDSPAHDTHRAMFYYQHDIAPGETAYVYQLFAADRTTVALRVGITAAGLVYLQDSTTGSGAADALSAALTVDNYYRFDLRAGGGAATLSIYNLGVINDVAQANAWDTLTITLTATSFSDQIIGLINTIAAGSGGVTGNLVDEGFEGGTNTTALSGTPSTTTTANQTTGSGALTHSTGYAAEGTIGLKIEGTASHMLRWYKTSRANTFLSLYFRFVTAPGANGYFLQVQNGANSAPAFQVGVGTDGKLRIRDSNNGTATVATAAFSTNTNYRVDVTADGAGDLTVRYYTGANISSTNTANAVQALTSVLTATNFADIQLGNVASVTTAMTYYVDRFKADNTALPTPLGGAAGGPISGYIERFQADSATMPTPLVIDTGGGGPGPSGEWSAILEPPAGKVILGASTPVAGANGTTAAGKAQYIAFAGRSPDILHFYSAAWNGTFTSAQRAMLEPTGGPRCIPMMNIKPGQGNTYLQIANGAINSTLNTFVANVMQYPYKIFVALYHESDNNSNRGNAGYTDANYVAMWRHVVTYCRGRGLKPAKEGGNVVWVWNQTGYSGQSGSVGEDLDSLFPGEDVVDWGASDPYRHQGGSPTDDPRFENICVEDDAGRAFGEWIQTEHPNLPWMLAEWGADYRTLAGHATGFSDSSNATWFGTVVEDVVQFPQLKALIYWNSTTDPNVTGAGSGIYYVQGRTLSEAAYAAMAANTIFDVDTAEAP